MVKPQGLSATLAQAFTYTNLPATSIQADLHAASGTTGSLNGVLEPGERVVLQPAVTNFSAAPVSATGTATAFSGPSGATYTRHDDVAAYGMIAGGDEQSCQDAGGDCYQVSVSVPQSRPATHWDATLTEQLSSGETWQRTVHIGSSFADVPPSHWAYRFVETMLHNGVTSGCGVGIYCPGATLARARMAVLLLMAEHGPDYIPPLSTGMVFADVPIDHWAGDFIEQLAAEGITAGCVPSLYCPDGIVTRAEMAVFLSSTFNLSLAR